MTITEEAAMEALDRLTDAELDRQQLACIATLRLYIEQSEAADRDAALSEQQIDALWVDFHLEPTEPATALELAFKAGARAAIQSSKEKN